MRSKHPDEFKSLTVQENERNESKKRKGSPTPTLRMKQATLKMCIEKNKLWDANNEKTKIIDKRISEMLVMDDLPFSHVEDVGFLRFVKEAIPLYQIRQRNYYRDIICEEMYDSVITKVSDL